MRVVAEPWRCLLQRHCVCGDKQFNTTGKGMPHGTSCSGHPGCSGQCNASAPADPNVLTLPAFV